MKKLTALVVTFGVLAACGGGAAHKTAKPATTATSVMTVHGSESERFETVADWRRAGLVALVTVQSERELPGPSEPEAGGNAPSPLTMRDVTVSVDRVLHGKAPANGTFTFRDFGWLVRDGVRNPVTIDSEVRLEPGDRALVALIGDGVNTNLSGLFTGSSTFKVIGSQIADTARPEPIIRKIESMSEPSAESYIRSGT